VALIALLWNSELSPISIFGGFGLLGIAAVSVARLGTPQDTVKRSKSLHQFALLLIVVIVFILVILKTPIFAKLSDMVLSQSDASIATATPLIWLGFSYLAFRLMALLLDYRAGRLPKEKLSLRDAITYALFFPAFTAGPIDRVQRFAPELEQAKALDSARLMEGGTRIAVGVFKKFIIADSLALVAMKPDLIERANGVSSLWILVYLYSLQIFFDFSGYSDVAIGLGRLYGITLPENFDRPYIQRNLQQFWQRWHITLSTWFRVYWFTPFSRTLIRSAYKIPQWVIVLLSQLTTMFLIGMWHGVTLNFAVWGIWHGVGLFLHKTLADNSKSWFKRVNEHAWSRRLMYFGSVFATFHFVTLGWVFFALPHVSDSLDLFLRLFGVRA
jgi:D-alanyl-lipoteichoic acid acyltransferase DltB (MBOAT superfamily)